MQPYQPIGDDRSGKATALERLKFIHTHLGRYDQAEVEFRQDTLTQNPTAVLKIERNGKGFLLTLQGEGMITDGSAFCVTRLGKILDRVSGQPLSHSPIDQFLSPKAPYDAWLSRTTEDRRAVAENQVSSSFPYNVYAADGIEVRFPERTYLIIAEREVEDSALALNLSINEVDRGGDLREVRRVFISRSVIDDQERSDVRERLSQAVTDLSQPESFDRGVLQLDRLVDDGFIIGNIDPELALTHQLGSNEIFVEMSAEDELNINFKPAPLAKVQYGEALDVDEIKFLTEHTRVFE